MSISIVSMTAIPVSADATSNSQAMINFFSGMEGDIQPTDGDLQVFGTFCSNFYTPYVTNQDNITDCIKAGCDALFSGSTPSGKQEAVDTLAKGVIANIVNNSQPLEYNGDNFYISNIYQLKNYQWGSGDEENATTREYTLSGKPLFALQSGDDKVSKIFAVSATNGSKHLSAASCSMATTLSLMAGLAEDTDATVTSVMNLIGENIEYTSSSHEEASAMLYITPFGDIIAKSGNANFTIIVPGCLNPYTFTTDGSIVPVANRFVISSLKGNSGNNVDGINAVLKMDNGSVNNTYVYGLGLDSDDDSDASSSDLDYVGYYFKFDHRVLKNIASAVAKERIARGHTADNNQGIDMIEDMSELLSNRYFYTSQADMKKTMQGILLFDFKSEGYKSLDEMRDIGLSYFYDDLNQANIAGDTTDIDGEVASDDDTSSSDDSDIGSYGRGKEKAGGLKVTSSNDTNTVVFYNFLSKKISGCKYFYNLTLPKSLSEIVYSGKTATSFMLYPQIFYTYMLNTYDGENTGFNPNLPKCDASSVSMIADMIANGVGVDADAQEMAKTLMKRMMSLTEEGMNDEKSSFLDSYINSFVIKNHRKMLGIADSNITSVSTNNMLYAGFTGHVTTPTLNDISFTKTLVDNYRTIYIIMLGLVVLFLAMMFITKTKSWKQCISLALVMAICLTLPVGVINGIVTLSNSITSNMYNNRFNYWAIVQHQQQLSNKFEADKSGNTIASYLADNVANNMAYYSDDGIKLRWMAPRKEDVFDSIFGNSLQDSETANGLINGAAVFKMLFSGYFKGETYSTDAMATYVYRTYKSVADEAKELAIQLNTGGAANASAEASSILDTIGAETKHPLDAIVAGISDKVDKSTEIAYYNENFRTAHIGNNTINSALERTDVAWGASEERTGFAIPSAAGGSDVDGEEVATTNIDKNMNAYLLYSESPFYYFYNALLQAQVDGAASISFSSTSGAVVGNTDAPPVDDTETDTSEEPASEESADDSDDSDLQNADLEVKNGEVYVNGFLPVLLSDDLYKVTDTSSPAYGMTKDFLDLEGLFTYVIPYMYQGNTICNDFVKLRGTDYRTWNTVEGDKTVLNTKEDIQCMWNMYCPWVDTMYSTDIINDSVSVMGKKYIIGDAFNPVYYHNTDETKGRNMVFGEAEMMMSGVGVDQLTEVERKINNVLNNTYEDLRYLANYSAFSDDTLITAAAMLATFNFNKEFSEVKMFGESHVLYPQGYELKTFSYDAFLRLILLNSTGQSVMAKGDIYTTIVENTSFLTGLFLLGLDFVAVYIVPAAKMVFLVGVFVLSVLMLLTCFLQGIENAPKTIINVVVMPMLKFLLVTILHATVTALLMGEGLTNLVGSQHGSIVTNDPTVTIVILLGINALAAVFYIVFIVGIIKEGIAWFKSTITAATGLIKGVVSSVSGKITDIAATGEVHGGLSVNNSSGGVEKAAAVGAGAAVGAAAASGIRGANFGNSGDSGAEMSRQYNNTMSKVLGKIKGSKNNKSAMTEEEKAKEQERIEKAKAERAEKREQARKKAAVLSSKAAQKVQNSTFGRNMAAVGNNIKSSAKQVGATVKQKVGTAAAVVGGTAVARTVRSAGKTVGSAVTTVSNKVGRAGKAVGGVAQKAGGHVKNFANGTYLARMSDKAAVKIDAKMTEARAAGQTKLEAAQRRTTAKYAADDAVRESKNRHGADRRNVLDMSRTSVGADFESTRRKTQQAVNKAQVNLAEAEKMRSAALESLNNLTKRKESGESVSSAEMKEARINLKNAKSGVRAARSSYNSAYRTDRSEANMQATVNNSFDRATARSYDDAKISAQTLNKSLEKSGMRTHQMNALKRNELDRLDSAYKPKIQEVQANMQEAKKKRESAERRVREAKAALDSANRSEKTSNSDKIIREAQRTYDNAKDELRTYKNAERCLVATEKTLRSSQNIAAEMLS